MIILKMNLIKNLYSLDRCMFWLRVRDFKWERCRESLFFLGIVLIFKIFRVFLYYFNSFIFRFGVN